MRTVVEIPAQIDNNKANNALRVAAYCRVSSDHEEQETSLGAQISYYSKKTASTPGWVNARIFAERGSGLSLWQRQEFMRMMELVRNGEIDLILTKSISRFGRNTVDMLQASLDLCGCGVDVFFEKENVWLHDRQMQICFIEGVYSVENNYKVNEYIICYFDILGYKQTLLNLGDPFSNFDFSNNETVQEFFRKYQMDYSPIWLNYMLSHKIIVERNLAIAEDEKTRKKYIWCKNYHNEICKANDIYELIIE